MEARYQMALITETNEYFVISVVPRLQIDRWVLWATPDSQQQIFGADAGS